MEPSPQGGRDPLPKLGGTLPKLGGTLPQAGRDPPQGGRDPPQGGRDPGVNSPRGEISPHLLCVNAMKTLTKDRGELAPGRDFTCKGALRIRLKVEFHSNPFHASM